MVKLELIEFENKEKLHNAIETIIDKKEAFRSYTKDGEQKTIKVISNGRLYIGNNFSIAINESDSGKIYLSIDYFAVDDRIKIAQMKSEEFKEGNQI